MTILAWIVVGLIAGWLADMVMKSKGRGILFSLILGVVGALVGGFIANALFGLGLTGFDLRTIIIAFLGAVIVIALIRALPGRSPV